MNKSTFKLIKVLGVLLGMVGGCMVAAGDFPELMEAKNEFKEAKNKNEPLLLEVKDEPYLETEEFEES